MNIFGIGDIKKKLDETCDAANATMSDAKRTINDMKNMEQEAIDDIKKKSKMFICLEVVKTASAVIGTALICFIAYKVSDK